MAALQSLLDYTTLPESVCIDVTETDDGYAFVCDIPGATAETTDLWIDDGRLHIEARREKPVPDGFRYCQDERSMYLELSIPLPSDWELATAPTATVENGVLVVEVSVDDPGVQIPVREP